MFAVIIVLFVVIISMLIYASFSIGAGFYMKSLCCNEEVKDAISITFDDGVNPDITPKVLDVLRKHNVKATFFVIGENVRANGDILKMVVDEGHLIGNHSYSHKWNLPFRSSSYILNEIRMCNDCVEPIYGEKIRFFRPPFGVTNPNIAKGVRRGGLISVGWSVRSLDTTRISRERVKERVLGRIKGGDVVLLHDNREYADLLLNEIILGVKERGLRIVTIDELFNII